MINIFKFKDISDKVFKIVADQGANVKKAFKATVSCDQNRYNNILSDMLEKEYMYSFRFSSK
jgi:hypothetical protein